MRSLFVLLLLVPIPVSAQEKPKAPDLAWTDGRNLALEGKGWAETKSPYDRLPAKAEKVVRDPVWNLSRHSAGLCLRFSTDASEIHAKWTLTSKSLAMAHMPATGVSGLDLYIKSPDGKWRWLAVGMPNEQSNTVRLVAGLPAGKHDFLLYLPLYNGVSEVQVGIPKGHTLTAATSRPAGADKPIVFYGTSITQGGCASRPGMVHTAILGRWLDRPVINLGFSGNGRMEPELAHLMAELDPCVYVLDCLPNLGAKEVSERVEPFVAILRQAHPSTPILLVEDRSYTNSHALAGPKERNAASRAALKQAYEKLKKSGTPALHYLAGEALLGDDSEGTVDSSHPTDLGFLRQAEAFAAALRPILK